MTIIYKARLNINEKKEKKKNLPKRKSGQKQNTERIQTDKENT